MYEPEVNDAVEPAETLPAEVRAPFTELRDVVVARSTIPWGEHCTECVWPVCYTSCALYEPRADGACRQFIGSAVRIDHRAGLSPYILKVRFKQWAKFWAPGTLELKPLNQANRAELVQIAVATAARVTPLPSRLRKRVLGKINYRRRLAAERTQASGESPDCFLLECFNPNAQPVSLTFTVRPHDRSTPLCFQQSIALPTGYMRARIPYAEIASAVDLARRFEVEIVPNGCENMTLYFGLMDFVKEAATAERVPQPRLDKPIKCIVWDLDNTLWDGVLLEDGPDGIRLRDHVVDLVRSTDARGILHSIASKNDLGQVIPLLKRLEIDDYFLFPQVGWMPKSESIRHIARQLDIAMDAIAFIDDQPFEREQVRAALPDVRVFDAAECRSILELPGCQGAVTEESRRRREMYREQQQREIARVEHSGDYLSFLRSCDIRLSIHPLAEVNLRRVYELAQRTNQMNFSGNRYDEPELRRLLRSDRACFVVHCRDRFGDYGIVGFAVVDTVRPCLIDLMFSCRVQAKRVEHAVLAFLLRRFTDSGQSPFLVLYRRTDRNAAAGQVFDQMGFERAGEEHGADLLRFPSGRAIPDDGLAVIENTVQAGADA